MHVARHLSIAWGVTLAVLALLEWNSLGREPLREPVLSPFIERSISLEPASGTTARAAGGQPQTVVELHFNGPLFLLCFFAPVVIFSGLGLVFDKLRERRG
jgi:hypothetical protein